ncbi:MAG: RluA family pseudouridine synthase [Phycisphaerales bacterium]|jgi:tRNA pseudouridine32 synthase/23S rRNA pseudouridine746 synthase|nr:RluA family pseudouridine synthase [Phycisphaerales bacterium]
MNDLPPILFQDQHVVAFDKPSGLLSVPGIGPEKADCMASRAARDVEGARIVHRLDRDTSGVILMARDADTHRELSRQFHDREVRKMYQAILEGHVSDEEGLVDAALRKDFDRPPRHLVDHEQGREARTNWKVLERMDAPPRTRIMFNPETGRSHQLRIHACTLGHPILGDDLYAPPEIVKLSERLLLHAESLAFTHPASGDTIEIRAEVPF